MIESGAAVEPLAVRQRLWWNSIAAGYRENPEGMEGNTGVVASGKEETGKERPKLTDRRSAATFHGARTIMPLTYVATTRLGTAGAQKVVILHNVTV